MCCLKEAGQISHLNGFSPKNTQMKNENALCPIVITIMNLFTFVVSKIMTNKLSSCKGFMETEQGLINWSRSGPEYTPVRERTIDLSNEDPGFSSSPISAIPDISPGFPRIYFGVAHNSIRRKFLKF